MKAFVDTNVLLYAHDRQAGAKRRRARDLLEGLWNEGRGILSTQVLQEFYVNVRRKTRPALSPAEARTLVADYLTWVPVVTGWLVIVSGPGVGRDLRVGVGRNDRAATAPTAPPSPSATGRYLAAPTCGSTTIP